MSYQEFRPKSFSYLPPVIKNLLIINVLMFVAKFAFMQSLHIDLDNLLGLHYFAAPDFKPYQLITYMFMHADIGHIFFNMFALWMFGTALENLWGAKRFLIYYFVAGIGAALVQYVVFYIGINSFLNEIDTVMSHYSRESFEALVGSATFGSKMNPELYAAFERFAGQYDAAVNSGNTGLAASLGQNYLLGFKGDYLNSLITIGASGAVYGILLAFGMTFPNTYIYIYFLVPIKAKWLVIIYGGLELFSGLSQRSDDNVAHFAHLGGMLFGFILLLIWKKNRNYFY